MKKVTILLLALIIIGCGKDKEKVKPELIYGKWQIYISPEDRKKLKTGMQKMFFVFNKDGTGNYYFYNVDFEQGKQYARKDEPFKYEILEDKIKITWLDDNKTVYWPYSFKDDNEFLILSDPTPGATFTFVLEKVKETE